MLLIQLIVTLVVVGVVLFLVQKAPFIAGQIKTIITWLVVACVVLWILQLFGILDMLRGVQTPHVSSSHHGR